MVHISYVGGIYAYINFHQFSLTFGLQLYMLRKNSEAKVD